jgi:prevent-host-death family protein
VAATTAKAQLRELREAALQGQPQRITRRGKDAVMVLSESAYLSMKRNGAKLAPDYVAHLLAIPKAASKLTPEQVSAEPLVLSGKPNIKLCELDL